MHQAGAKGPFLQDVDRNVVLRDAICKLLDSWCRHDVWGEQACSGEVLRLRGPPHRDRPGSANRGYGLGRFRTRRRGEALANLSPVPGLQEPVCARYGAGTTPCQAEDERLVVRMGGS